ncbi:MAG: tetratricopeptide repeat protein [Deltaproteobacteria bacterium]|nr:tetratricopeptide repeat protein [Deltaproteobacteria bacterium]
MPFVRVRGNQLAIVHGVRSKGTKNIDQQTLFTIYSRPEAEAIVGKGEAKAKAAARFEGMLENKYPSCRFDWKAIKSGIRENLGVLPESYDYKAARLQARFWDDALTFFRQLVLVDPQSLASASALIAGHRLELEYLRETIDFTLRVTRDREASEWTADNEFYWRFATRNQEVPGDVEEHAAAYLERGDLVRARAAFKMLTDAFPEYAEGHNYLGLVALEEQKLDEAISEFEKTIEIGRRLFPKRVGKDRWWSDLDTRPYMRGLRNLTLTLNRAGRFKDALALAERLETECHDDVSAAAFKASACLNLARFDEALQWAVKIVGIHPSESLVAAFACKELGRADDARAYFLHAVMNSPRTVAMVLQQRMPAPREWGEGRDHNHGISMVQALHGYLKTQSSSSRRFYLGQWKDRTTTTLVKELLALTKEWAENRGSDRRAFDRLTEMRKLEFARAVTSPVAFPMKLSRGHLRTRQ